MNAEAEGRQAAEEFRNRHQLGLAPIDDIIDLAYKAGYDVVCLSTSADEHGITAREQLRQGPVDRAGFLDRVPSTTSWRRAWSSGWRIR